MPSNHFSLSWLVKGALFQSMGKALLFSMRGKQYELQTNQKTNQHFVNTEQCYAAANDCTIVGGNPKPCSYSAHRANAVTGNAGNIECRHAAGNINCRLKGGRTNRSQLTPKQRRSFHLFQKQNPDGGLGFSGWRSIPTVENASISWVVSQSLAAYTTSKGLCYVIT